MEMFKKLLSTTLLALSLTSISANAELTKTDWQSTGDNKVIFDTNTGLEWLENSYAGGSIQSVVNRMVKGGDLEGWTFATPEQVLNLWDSNGRSTVYNTFLKTYNGTSHYVAQRWYGAENDSTGFIGLRNGNSFHNSNGYLTANQYGWWIVRKGPNGYNPEVSGELVDLSDSSSNLFSVPEGYASPNDVSVGSVALILGLLFLLVGGGSSSQPTREDSATA